MNPVIQRRVVGTFLVLIFSVLFGVIDFALRSNMGPASLFSGVCLILIVLMLAGFNARKKLPFLPLIRASTWMQIHIYVGYFAIILFLIHIQFRLPNGPLEITLALLFVIVSLSGILGLILSRMLPSRLSNYGENLLFERVPAMRKEVCQEAETLVIESVSKTNSSVIADFYESQLRNYLDRRIYGWHTLIGNKRPLNQVQANLKGLERFLNDEGRAITAQLADLIQLKDNLDFQRTAQGLLKGWLFVHIPLTYSLIVVAAIHGYLAWTFS